VHTQGSVVLSLAVPASGSDEGDTTCSRDVVCSVPQASVLLWALDLLSKAEGVAGTVSIAELAAVVGLPPALVLSIASFWAAAGALQVDGADGGGGPQPSRPHDTVLVSLPSTTSTAAAAAATANPPSHGVAASSHAPTAPSAGHSGGSDENDDDDDDDDDDEEEEEEDDLLLLPTDSGGVAAATEAEEEDPPEAVAMWTSFVEGMLTNLGPLPLDRIHANLQLFAGMGPYPYEKAVGELHRLLATLAAAGTITVADSLYALP